MTKVEQLKNLLENEIIQDLEAAIDETFQMVEKEKTISLADREELEGMQEMHQECRDILIEIEADEMDEEEAGELLSELIEIKTE
ncbi:MAG: hypothetical protein HF962_08755 [Sulfurovum sp.]|nr:hypothetical protein [Sulfurovum sp.]